jgi:hypothetical protein
LASGIFTLATEATVVRGVVVRPGVATSEGFTLAVGAMGPFIEQPITIKPNPAKTKMVTAGLELFPFFIAGLPFHPFANL